MIASVKSYDRAFHDVDGARQRIPPPLMEVKNTKTWAFG